ncbi:MAG: carbohydrate ABC transporter permease [Chloroflexi bacterium]|nr:carbohydrate ABC transporter permease [Chloroflexota bacterium]
MTVEQRIDQVSAQNRIKFAPILYQLLLQGIALIFTIFFFGPFLWTIFSSFKNIQEIAAFPPTLLPKVWEWQNYVQAWTQQPFDRWTLNSLVVAFFAVIGLTLSSATTAFAFARFRFPGRDALFLVLMGTLILPREITLIPLFILFKNLKWLDTLLPLIVPNFLAVGSNGAFFIFLLRQAIMTIPREYDEAAKVDGASSWWIFWQIIWPLSSSTLITVAVFAFLFNWNEFLYPLVFLSNKANFTLPVGLRFYQTLGMDTRVSYEHLLMAASVLASLPPIILFFIGQRYLIRGTLLSGLKG